MTLERRVIGVVPGEIFSWVFFNIMEYGYIKVPTNLFYLMDANCTKVLITLIQMSDFYPKQEGYFECAYEYLILATGLSQNVIKATLDALYQEGLIDVKSVGKGKGKCTNQYKINTDKFKDYESTPVGIAVVTKDKPIHTLNYKNHYTPSFSGKQTGKQIGKKVTTNINNIDNTNNIDNKNTKELITEVINIPIKEKEMYKEKESENPGTGMGNAPEYLSKFYMNPEDMIKLPGMERTLQSQYNEILRRYNEYKKKGVEEEHYLQDAIDWEERQEIWNMLKYISNWDNGGRSELAAQVQGMNPKSIKDILIYLANFQVQSNERLQSMETELETVQVYDFPVGKPTISIVG